MSNITVEFTKEECEIIRKALITYDSSAKQLLRYGDWLRLRLKLDSILERVDAWRYSDKQDLDELIETIDDEDLTLEEMEWKY